LRDQPTQAGKQLNDLELAELISDIHDVFPGYGYRRITLELKAGVTPSDWTKVDREIKPFAARVVLRRPVVV